jgi:chemotaxis protein CheD
MQQQIEIFLQPGEYFVGGAEYRVRTLLGSCVSVALWHPTRRIGGMSHFLLAQGGRNSLPTLDGRYGNDALRLLLRGLSASSVEPRQCQAKLVGGGNMFPRHQSGRAMHIGQKNGEAARSLLAEHGIPIVSESLFGAGHRQVVFDIATGDVWVRQVRPAGLHEETPGGTV